MSARAEREKPNVFRLMPDEVLQDAIRRLERDLDRCEAMQEPQASAERQRVPGTVGPGAEVADALARAASARRGCA
jgi:hypothetical protein